MAESRWQDIFLHLKNEGFEIYSPGIKTGECKSEYIVVKNNGSSKLAAFMMISNSVDDVVSKMVPARNAAVVARPIGGY